MREVRRRLRRLTAVALIVAIAVIVVVATITSSRSSGSGGAAKTATGAATVQRRNLVEADTESGTLGYADPQTVYNRLSGTITWLPRVGQVIRPGQRLFKVDGLPVILMRGSTPAYRDLGSSDSAGPDIKQLNRSLVDLGFDNGAIVVDDEWQAATTEGVDLLQASLGEAETGRLALGDVVFEPHDQLISAVDTTVGSTGGGGGGSAATQPSTTAHAAAPEFVSLDVASAASTTSASDGVAASPSDAKPTATPASTTAWKQAGLAKRARQYPRGSTRRPRNSLTAIKALLRAEGAQLKAQVAQLKSLERLRTHSTTATTKATRRARSSSTSSSNNAGATAILQTTSTRLVVGVDLSASSQSEAKVGEHVTVELPAGNTVGGKITAVSAVAENASSSAGGSGSGSGAGGSASSTSTVPVTITLSGHHSGAGLDHAAVSVNFAKARAKHVLSVPVTALLATSGSTYAVQEVAAPHKLIAATTGLFAGGYVQISGPGIHPGLHVSDSQG